MGREFAMKIKREVMGREFAMKIEERNGARVRHENKIKEMGRNVASVRRENKKKKKKKKRKTMGREYAMVNRK